jgi:hypothetical protein
VNFDTNTPEGLKQSVRWTQGLFASMREGAVWVVPRSNTKVCVHHSTKRVTITDGHSSEDVLRKVIKEMGWTINEGEKK